MEAPARPGPRTQFSNKGLVAVASATVLTASFATSGGAFFAGPGQVDRESASINGSAIQGLRRLLLLLGCAHSDKSEAAGSARGTVHHQIGLGDRAVGGKRVLEVVFREVEGEVSNKQFIIHDFILSRLIAFPD